MWDWILGVGSAIVAILLIVLGIMNAKIDEDVTKDM